jgi:hypothetical protein
VRISNRPTTEIFMAVFFVNSIHYTRMVRRSSSHFAKRARNGSG